MLHSFEHVYINNSGGHLKNCACEDFKRIYVGKICPTRVSLKFHILAYRQGKYIQV